jgi:GT2 family glycosyltransferase
VPNADDRSTSRARPLDQASEESALCWSADRLVELLPLPDPPQRVCLPWGLDAWHDPSYQRWLRQSSRRDDERAGNAGDGPLISVVVPVYRPKLWFFKACVDSVKAQRYQRWELCMCDDASGDPQLRAMLNELAGSDQRIKVVSRAENGGISLATNDALGLASGEFVALLDHDDVLEPGALAEVAAAIEAETDVLYSDEDKIDDEEDPLDTPRLFCPHFKPDWSPDLLLNNPYMGHLLVIRRELLQQIGGFRSEYDGSQDYDVMLRATERARQVTHVPKVLYHWRAVPGSAADDLSAKPWAHAASRRALEEAVRRRGIDAVVEDGSGPGSYHVRRRVRGNPSVTIVIPFRDQAQMTAQCLSSLDIAPGYENFEVLLVDNGSTEPEVRALRSRWNQQGVRVLDYPDTFNWSAINNMAAANCDSEILLFMNNDIEATQPRWLLSMVELAQREDVGAVGARLLYPDGVIQHAGVTLGLGLVAAHLFAGMPVGAASYMGRDLLVRDCNAVTGACMMSRRAVFEEVGGFDESLEVAFNDVDYCLRLQQAGYHVLYTPHAELVHHESASRGISGFLHDIRHLLRRWDREVFLNDPFYNPNLSLVGSWCGLRKAEEVPAWEHHMSLLLEG